MIMEWIRTESGSDVVMLGNTTYINFGDESSIKWIHLSFLDDSGTRRGQLLPVTLGKVKREYSRLIGKKNLLKIRSLIKPRLDGVILSREKFQEIGKSINDDLKSLTQ